MKRLPLAPQYQKRLLQISTISMRNTHNNVKVEKTSATCNNKHRSGQPSWDGWLIAGNTYDMSVTQNKLILRGYVHFNTMFVFFKSFHTFSQHNNRIFAATVWKIFHIIPYPLLPTLKERVVNICQH